MEEEQLRRMSDRDLLVEVATTQKHMRGDIAALSEHQRDQNGAVADLKAAELIQRGALMMLSGLMAIGISVAGIVLAVVARGG